MVSCAVFAGCFDFFEGIIDDLSNSSSPKTAYPRFASEERLTRWCLTKHAVHSGDFTQVNCASGRGDHRSVNRDDAGRRVSRRRAGHRGRVSVPDGAAGGTSEGTLPVNGQSRNRIARINADGTLHSWNPAGPNNTVYSMLLDGNTLYVGGLFTTMNGATRTCIAALDTRTGSVLSWAQMPLRGKHS
jgi:hypothetical protein